MIASSVVYRDGRPLDMAEKSPDLPTMFKAAQAEPGAFVSVGLHEPDQAEMAHVAKTFGLHPLAVEDAVHAVQRPKLERYGDMTFLVVKSLRYSRQTDRLDGGQVAMFVGPSYVVTVRQAPDLQLADLRHDLEQQADVLKQGPVAVVYTICDRIVDTYEQLVSDLESQVDAVESVVFSATRTDASKRIYQLNSELTTLDRAVQPLQGPMQRFADAEVAGVSKEAAPFFRDVADHLSRVSGEVDSLQNLLSSAFDANLSRIGVQQNDDMRTMSAWAAIAAVITVLAGIYGMNFVNMPELRWSFGYPALLLLMAGLSLWLYRRFKKSGWL